MKKREVIKVLITINLVILQGTNVVYAERDIGAYPVNAVQADQVDNNVEMDEKVMMEEQHVREETYVDEGIVSRREDISEKLEGEPKNEYGDQSENQEISEEGDIVSPGTTAEGLHDTSNDADGKEPQKEWDGTAGEELQDVWDETAGEELQDVWDRTAGEELQDVRDRTAGEELQDVWNETAGEHLQNVSNDTENDGSQDISTNIDEASREIEEEPGQEKLQETSDGGVKQEMLVYDENGKVVGSYRYREKHVDTIQQLMNQITSDGIYTLHVQGLDSEGNPVVRKYVFSVNKTGTSFRYDEERANVYLEGRFAPVIELSNIDEVTILSCLVNGRAVGYEMQEGCLQIDENQIADGKNRITLEVKDGSGNISSMEPWEFYIKKESTKTNNINTDKVKIEKNGFWDKVLACFMRKIINRGI